jgi:peroxiredoxin
MRRNLPTLFTLLVPTLLWLATGGCTQSESPRADKPEAQAPDAAQADESGDEGVKLASAEGAVRPPAKKSAEPADPAAPAELPKTAAAMPLPLDNVETADLMMPKVVLTEHHAAMCKVKVGDRFPDLKLPDTSGAVKSLAEIAASSKLTLVVFWTAAEPIAVEQLADLAKYHDPRFAGEGLAIVAVNSGDPAPQAAELAKKAGAKFTVLCDVDGAALAQVATGKLPRSYVIDPAGQILWFDLEYSATTRRDMVQAIRFALAQR